MLAVPPAGLGWAAAVNNNTMPAKAQGTYLPKKTLHVSKFATGRPWYTYESSLVSYGGQMHVIIPTTGQAPFHNVTLDVWRK
jgi:hypothetical protein